MNAAPPLHQLTMAPPATIPQKDDIHLAEYWDVIVDNRWLVICIAAFVFAIGVTYAFLARPIYETNLLIQVEDSATSAKSFLGDAASLFDVKTPASGEIEIIRSRMVIGLAVDATKLHIEAMPKRLPLVGDWLARGATELSTPGLLGFGGWINGNESIDIGWFDVPRSLEGSEFVLKAGSDGQYRLSSKVAHRSFEGKVGTPLVAQLPDGELSLLVKSLSSKSGGEFSVVRHSRNRIVEDIQANLKLAEKGRQSGVIDATLQSPDRVKLAMILNEIGQQYVRQNVERKAAEAQKTLTFLDVQLPQFKRQLDMSEEAYNRYRNVQGTIALDEEAKLILGQSVELQTKLNEAKQKKLELISRFTPEHPSVRTLDAQIRTWEGDIAALNSRIKKLPTVQQDALRLERDVKVNNELYQQLRNNALQLQLIKEGKIGNVRVIDSAFVADDPVKPKRALTLALAAVLGVVGGIVFAIARNATYRALRNAQEIEERTGLSVYCTIPLSAAQDVVAKRVASREQGLHILANLAPQDVAVESLRSLRTALQFAMLDSRNNVVLITGATPGVGKSFVSANFAAILAIGGRRVLLIDADLRKGHLNQYFGIGRETGLSEVIAGSVDEAAAIRSSGLPNLDLLTTGALPPNPAELAISSSLAAFIQRVSTSYDLVIIDSAPVLVAADTAGIASHAGTILLVARSDQTQIGEMLESERRLAHAGTRVSGVIFNAVDLSRRHYGNYGYRYGGYKYQNYNYGGASQ